MDIAVLDTGGTFGKVYGNGAGVRDLNFGKVSAAQRIVDSHGIRGVKVEYDSNTAKDSLDMSDDDRKCIAKWCALQLRSVVVHGTDTMVDTASVIACRVASLRTIVVLTGALQPASMRESDAELNFGAALAAAQIASPGVYIVMGARVYPWDRCYKNPLTGRFQSK